MRYAIMVNERQGTYDIHPNAAPEAWAEVLKVVQPTGRVEPLQGWASHLIDWRWAVQTTDHGWYFVAGAEPPLA